MGVPAGSGGAAEGGGGTEGFMANNLYGPNGPGMVGVAKVAKRFNVPVIGIAGSLTADVGVVHQHGLDAVFSVLYTICTLDEALANAAANLRMTARNVAAVLQMGDKR